MKPLMPTPLALGSIHKVNMKLVRIYIYFAFNKKQNTTWGLAILGGHWIVSVSSFFLHQGESFGPKRHIK